MASKIGKLYGPGEAAAEEAAAKARIEAKHQAALKYYLVDCACCDCGAFGSWGDGQFRYCREHVPHDLLNAAAAFERRKREKLGG